MRILYVINAFTYAGAEKLVFHLALQMAERADYIGIIALYRKRDRAEAQMIEALSQAGIDTRILGKRAGRDRVGSVREIRRFLKTRQIQLIHAHCPVPMLLAKIAGRLAGVPVICTVHNTRGYQWDRFTAWMARAYIACGEATELYMRESLRIPAAKISRIYNAVDAQTLGKAQKEEHFWETYGGRAGEQAILHIGRICYQKNQICMLRAFQSMIRQGYTGARLYILGDYNREDPIYRELLQYLDEQDLTKYVCFLGVRQNVQDFLANADCFLMTSRYEGFCVALLEAVISGCAVVATELPFVRELNAIAPCVTVIPQNDAQRLADILMKKDYRRQSRETAALISRKFSMDRFVEEQDALYKRVRYGTIQKSGS